MAALFAHAHSQHNINFTFFSVISGEKFVSFKWLICCLIKVVNNFKLK